MSYIEFEGTKIEVDSNKELYEIVKNDNKKDIPIVLCKVNNKYYELRDKMIEGTFQPIRINEEIGMKTYLRTLQFLFIKVVLDIFKDSKITIEHSINKGVYGEVHMNKKLNNEDVDLIKKKMKELINKNVKINKIKIDKNKAIEIFKSYGMYDKVKLLKHLKADEVKLYELDGRYDYFYGKMAYSTGILKYFDLMYYDPGFILRVPDYKDPKVIPPFIEQKKLRQIFRETEKWINILGVADVGSLDDKIVSGEIEDLIRVNEALHEKKIAQIADMIKDKKDVKIVLIAGPSSSGKTTFARRLGIQLRVNGLIPIPISLDDYFVSREKTPLDENGEKDFEAIEALDLQLFNTHLNKLLNGEEVEIPSYNFKNGKREWVGNILKIPKNGVLIIEGIHGLNNRLTSEIPDENKFKIYISALTQLNLDNHNRIQTTDVRKIRRIVRDYISRGYGGETTLLMWPSIRRGEKKNIFVFQEEADVMFNSNLVYELCVLKRFALYELDKISENSPVYEEAKRLKTLLQFFKEVPEGMIPNNSILREFVGGSCFYKY